MTSLELQQALANADLGLLPNNAAAFVGELARKCGVPAAGDHLATFHAALSAIWRAKLGSWILDYVAIVCCDPGFASSDPQQQALLVRVGAAAATAAAAPAHNSSTPTLPLRRAVCRSPQAWAPGWQRLAASCRGAWSSC